LDAPTAAKFAGRVFSLHNGFWIHLNIGISQDLCTIEYIHAVKIFDMALLREFNRAEYYRLLSQTILLAECWWTKCRLILLPISIVQAFTTQNFILSIEKNSKFHP